jgi:GTPase SAR1 family protein
MIQKKVCMVGTSGVGKTSLVAKFVHSIFSDKYLTTVGVKIACGQREVARSGASLRVGAASEGAEIKLARAISL